jgi:membrane protein YqaA with SNARE-associated domain
MVDYVKWSIAVISILLMGVGYLYRNKLKRFKKYGYLGIFLVSLLSNVAVLSPAAPFVSMMGGTLYNVWLIGLVAGLGATIADILPYNLGSVGDTALTDNKWYQLTKHYMQQNGFITVFILSLIPNPFFDLAGVIAGLTGFSFWLFLLASFLGKILKYTFFAFVGHSVSKHK